MATTEAELLEFLKSNPPVGEFKPYTLFSREADAITVYWSGEPDTSERLNEQITLYRSIATGEVVGCRIKGIAAMQGMFSIQG